MLPLKSNGKEMYATFCVGPGKRVTVKLLLTEHLSLKYLIV